MTGISVTSTANRVNVEFGDYSLNPILESYKSSFHKEHISSVYLKIDSVLIHISGEKYFSVSHDGSGNTFKIDNINGVAPTSLSDLYNKILIIID